MSKILVSYFSITGTTKRKAEILANEVGGDLFEIKAKEPYKEEDLEWVNGAARSRREYYDDNAKPEIFGIPDNIEEYDTIYLCFPIWWNISPKVIRTFIESIDNKKKKFVTFCTSGGAELEPATEYLKSVYPKLKIENGRRLF